MNTNIKIFAAGQCTKNELTSVRPGFVYKEIYFCNILKSIAFFYKLSPDLTLVKIEDITMSEVVSRVALGPDKRNHIT